MRISGLFHAKPIMLSISFAGVLAFAGGCGDGGGPATSTPADSKKIEQDQTAARQKAFGPTGNVTGNPAAKGGAAKP